MLLRSAPYLLPAQMRPLPLFCLLASLLPLCSGRMFQKANALDNALDQIGADATYEEVDSELMSLRGLREKIAERAALMSHRGGSNEEGGGRKVKVETDVGSFVITLHEEWSPLGVQRFTQLIEDKFYDNAALFRVVPGFVVQFGIPADPSLKDKYPKIKDDPSVGISNSFGTVTFATSGANTRTTQIFVNIGDSPYLDNMGFTPFGKVEGAEDMEVVASKVYEGYGEQADQGEYTFRGDSYIREHYPHMTHIKSASFLD